MRHFMAQGDPMSMEKCVLMLLLYHSIGRAGEVAATNFNLLHWDDTHFLLWSGWHQMKASHGGEVWYISDSMNYEFDIIHALATYVITAGHKLSKHGLAQGPNGEVVPELVWLIMTFEDMKTNYNKQNQNCVVKAIVSAMDTSELSHETIYKWGTAIKCNYMAKNVLARCDNSSGMLKAEVATLTTST
jgi:hypothetical protein